MVAAAAATVCRKFARALIGQVYESVRQRKYSLLLRRAENLHRYIPSSPEDHVLCCLPDRLQLIMHTAISNALSGLHYACAAAVPLAASLSTIITINASQAADERPAHRKIISNPVQVLVMATYIF